MDIQKFVNAISEASARERGNYHATYGDLIDKLKIAPETARISPKVVGIGAYRSYYSDIALCTESEDIVAFEQDYEGISAEDWEKNRIRKEFPQNPKELAEVLESLIGKYFDGYKGGCNEITREKPLWLASDYGNSSNIAVIQITDNLELITKIVK